MELYGKAIALSSNTLAILEQKNSSPYILSEMLKEAMSRNYYLLKKYSQKYKRVSHKTFLEKVRCIALEQKNRHKRKPICEQRKSSPDLPTLRAQSNRLQLKKSLNSYRSIKNDQINEKRGLSRGNQFGTQIKKTLKFPKHRKHELNVVWLGQNQLINHEKFKKYMSTTQQYLLIRLHKQKKNSSKMHERRSNLLSSLSIQYNNHTISKFLETSTRRPCVPYFRA